VPELHAASATPMTTTHSHPVDHLLRRVAVLLAAATIIWNIIEAGVSLAAGAATGSVALVTFGIDALIEVGSASVVLWQYSGHDSDARSRTALEAIAVSFFALAVYAGGRGTFDLATGSRPDASAAGITIAALSLVVMPLLAIQKRRVGRKLGSITVMADSAQTILCTYLSAALLAGLALNAAFGWWWADPLVALVVAALAIAEGRAAWNGDADCCATPRFE
jgi:divalent metal cation (Fe/Co/Zn/Cd) transporter